MVTARRLVQTAGVLITAALLTACAPNASAEADAALSQQVQVSIDAMREALLVTAEGAELDPATYSPIAGGQALGGLDDLPVGEASSMLFCLQQEENAVTACVFYPMTISSSAGLDVDKSSVYGCAVLSGRPGGADVTVDDTECPPELVAWFVAKPSVEDAEKVSIRDLSGLE